MSLNDGPLVLWDLHRGGPVEKLVTQTDIDTGVMDTTSTLNGATIHGRIDPQTGAISFNDRRSPTKVFFVSFYTGFRMDDFMAGTFQETEFPRTNDPLLKADAGPAAAPVGDSVMQGSWYAVQTGILT